MLRSVARFATRARMRVARALRHPSRLLCAFLAALALAAALVAASAARRRVTQRRKRRSFAALFGDTAGDEAHAARCLAGADCVCEYICSDQGCLLSPGRFGASIGAHGRCVRSPLA